MPHTPKREIIEIVVVAIGFLTAIPIVFFLSLPNRGDVVRIDCTWSEISPDFTVEMREACRQLRATNTLQKSK